jgi:type II secretory pathway component GspD/PulD (secretin)
MVIVEAPASTLRTIDRIVAEFDVPPLQCDIEAVILSVEHDHNQEFGVNFAIADTGGNILGIFGDGSRLASTAGLLPGAALNLTGILGTASVSTSTGAAATSSSTGSSGIVPGSGFVNPEGGLKLANTRNGVASLIRAIKATGKVDILARPHLMVVNSDEASLLLGSKLAYSTISQSAISTTQQVEFLDVGTQLRVRPFIMSDGNIRMEVHPERSSGAVINNLPQTTTSEVTTNVIVPNGATLIIAGLVDDEKDRQQDGLPILGDLPLLGALFRERFVTHTKKELVVLLTPRIWNPARMMCEPPPVQQQGPSLLAPPSPLPTR